MKDFFIGYFSLINVLSFLTFGFDKYKAQNNQQRISEKFLLFISLFGATIGTVLGMIVFNHKTSKKCFLFKILAIILSQILIIYLIYNYNQ
jgi:uncharacterized membrane protein YsdA (DUF1294 family)